MVNEEETLARRHLRDHAGRGGSGAGEGVL